MTADFAVFLLQQPPPVAIAPQMLQHHVSLSARLHTCSLQLIFKTRHFIISTIKENGLIVWFGNKILIYLFFQPISLIKIRIFFFSFS